MLHCQARLSRKPFLGVYQPNAPPRTFFLAALSPGSTPSQGMLLPPQQSRCLASVQRGRGRHNIGSDSCSDWAVAGARRGSSSAAFITSAWHDQDAPSAGTTTRQHASLITKHSPSREGSWAYVLNGSEGAIEAGSAAAAEPVCITPNAPHTFWNGRNETVLVVDISLQPPLNAEAFFRTISGMSPRQAYDAIIRIVLRTTADMCVLHPSSRQSIQKPARGPLQLPDVQT